MVRDFNRSDLVNKCDNCGATWDQDANAARNILAAFASGQVVEK
jgi:transposase